MAAARGGLAPHARATEEGARAERERGRCEREGAGGRGSLFIQKYQVWIEPD